MRLPLLHLWLPDRRLLRQLLLQLSASRRPAAGRSVLAGGAICACLFAAVVLHLTVPQYAHGQHPWQQLLTTGDVSASRASQTIATSAPPAVWPVPKHGPGYWPTTPTNACRRAGFTGACGPVGNGSSASTPDGFATLAQTVALTMGGMYRAGRVYAAHPSALSTPALSLVGGQHRFGACVEIACTLTTTFVGAAGPTAFLVDVGGAGHTGTSAAELDPATLAAVTTAPGPVMWLLCLIGVADEGQAGGSAAALDNAMLAAVTTAPGGPGMWALCLTGVLGVGMAVRRRRRHRYVGARLAAA